MSAITLRAAVDGDRLSPIGSPQQFNEQIRRAARRWGAGRIILIRMEPEDEGAVAGQFKHLFAHLYAPVAKRKRLDVDEVHLRMKAQLLGDDGRTSIRQLSREELAAYIEAVEQEIREHDPESWADCVAAMALFEQRRRE